MSLERTIRFISAIKNRFGEDVHLWMYTNGKLVTPAILRALQKAGLDEIRFNIYASHDFLEWFVKEQVEAMREQCPDLMIDVRIIEGDRPRWEYLQEMIRLPAVVNAHEKFRIRS